MMGDLLRNARWFLWLALLAIIAIGALWIAGRREAQAPSMIARYDLPAEKGACSGPPIRFVVASDLHVSNGTTPPRAVAAMVERINALQPDYVLLVGDYLGGGRPAGSDAIRVALGPLAGLRPRVGTAAVLGNHDWIDGPHAIAAILAGAGIHMLSNDAWITPDVAILGIEEITSNTANPALARERYNATLTKNSLAAPPIEIWLAHQPIMFDRVAGTGTLLIAGHSHGGQILPAISVPIVGLAVRFSRWLGFRASWPAVPYVRGLYSRGADRMLVTSGVGVGGLPIRLGVPPEIVLVRIPRECRYPARRKLTLQ
jgi:predicted MPP superfamily phosphohydrolase